MTTSSAPSLDSHQTSVARLEQLEGQLAKCWEIDRTLRSDEQAWALAIVDALNLLAKLEKNGKRREEIYRGKSDAVGAALALGCDAGIGTDDQGEDVLYMYNPNVGVVSVHIEYLGRVQITKRWPYAWCAIRRQRWAAAALEFKEIRDLLAEYTSPMATGKHNADFVRKAKAIAPYYQYAELEF